MQDAPFRPLPSYRRWIAPAAILVAAAAAYAMGLNRLLSFEAFVAQRAAIEGFVSHHLALALVIYAGLYILVVALSLPGAAALSISGGFLFGWLVSAPVSVIAATIGAVIVFEVVKTSFGELLAERSGPMVKKLSGGFARDAFSYLLFLRLVPAFPFFAVNVVAGLCNVSLRAFALATVIGIIPGAVAFSYLGTGLGSLIDMQTDAYVACVKEKGEANCTLDLDPSLLVTRELLAAMALLALLALIPMLLRRFVKPPGPA